MCDDSSLRCSYVFVKTARTPGEAFDIEEDVENFDIDIIDCSSEMNEDECCVCSKQSINLIYYCGRPDST